MDWQHASLLCPSLSPRICSNSCLLSWWCHLTISSSAAPFSCCLQSFPASGYFPMSWLFALGGQSTGTWASPSVLPIALHPTTECIFFSSSHVTFSKTDHSQGYKPHFHKFKSMEIIQCLHSENNGIKIEINNRKSPSTYRLFKMVLNYTWMKETSNEIKRYFELNEN